MSCDNASIFGLAMVGEAYACWSSLDVTRITRMLFLIGNSVETAHVTRLIPADRTVLWPRLAGPLPPIQASAESQLRWEGVPTRSGHELLGK